MTDLMKHKERSDARYAAAKAITKRLGTLEDTEDAKLVLIHVGLEFGMIVSEAKREGDK